MSKIVFTESTINDLLYGKATYIKERRLTYYGIIFNSTKISFMYKDKEVAFINIPIFCTGDTLTINFNGSMDIMIRSEEC